MLKTIDYAAFLPTVLVALGVHFFWTLITAIDELSWRY